jgi:predicted metalloprotease with PDZ domain
MEGFTSYYDELILVRSGYYSKEEYLRKLQSTLNYVEGTPGTRVQPVAHASFDAWIKGYRPNENSSNTTMTYYSRGALLGAYLDAMIIDKFDSKKCLDHFMRYLYDEFYIKKNRGFSDSEFKTALNTFMGQDMTFFFTKYVEGTEVPNYDEVFTKIGLKVNYVGKPIPSFGASFSQEGGKCIVKSVRAGSSAEQAGLSVGDEVVSCNGLRVDQTRLENFFASLIEGEYVNLSVAREEMMIELEARIQNYERPTYKLEPTIPSNEKFYYWLRELDH